MTLQSRLLMTADEIDPPLASGYLRAVRDASIREGLEGASAAEIARRFGTTRRNVFRIKAAGEDDDDTGQRQLF